MLTLILILLVVFYLIIRKKKYGRIFPEEIEISHFCIFIAIFFGILTIYGNMVYYIKNYDLQTMEMLDMQTTIIYNKAEIARLQKEYHDTLEDIELYKVSKKEWQKKLDETLDQIYELKDELEETEKKHDKTPMPSLTQYRVYKFLVFGTIPPKKSN